MGEVRDVQTPAAKPALFGDDGATDARRCNAVSRGIDGCLCVGHVGAVRTCSATVAAVRDKVLLGNVGLCVTGRSAQGSSEKGDLHMCKSSQWTSLPRQVWLDHYDTRAIALRRRSRQHTHLAPDEWWMVDANRAVLQQTSGPRIPKQSCRHFTADHADGSGTLGVRNRDAGHARPHHAPRASHAQSYMHVQVCTTPSGAKPRTHGHECKGTLLSSHSSTTSVFSAAAPCSFEN